MRLLYENKDNIIVQSIPDAIKSVLIEDLQLEKLAELLSLNGELPMKANEMLDLMTNNKKDIIRRQEAVKDLFGNEDLYDRIYSIYQKMRGLSDISDSRRSASDRGINNYVVLIKWLDLFCIIIMELESIFREYKVRAHSLLQMKKVIHDIFISEEFSVINKNVKKMSLQSQMINSAKLGINLDEYLEPVSINCISVNDFYYYPRKMADIGIGSQKKVHGIGQFKYIPKGGRRGAVQKVEESSLEVSLISTSRLQRLITCEVDISFVQGINSFLKSLNFNNRKDISTFILKRIDEIVELTLDLGFLLGGVKLAKRLVKYGMPVTLAVSGEKECKIYDVKSLYNCYLPFILENPSAKIVCNDFRIGGNEVFGILSGPNKGGKTTIIQAMAISIILFQLGLHTTCKEAIISPFDMIFTHFQREESKDRTGRFAIEAESIRMIFENASENSLVILNEPYVSTTPTEGVFMIINTLSALKELECRGILVTHFHKLNDKIKKLNTKSGRKFKFMNMGINCDSENGRRTYELNMGSGEVKSYAIDILREYAPDLIQ